MNWIHLVSPNKAPQEKYRYRETFDHSKNIDLRLCECWEFRINEILKFKDYGNSVFSSSQPVPKSQPEFSLSEQFWA